MLNHEVGGVAVGKVTVVAFDAAFQIGRVKPGTQHFFIVIRFQEKDIGVLDGPGDIIAAIPGIGDNADFDTLVMETEQGRVNGVVAFGQGLDFGAADIDCIVGADEV